MDLFEFLFAVSEGNCKEGKKWYNPQTESETPK